METPIPNAQIEEQPVSHTSPKTRHLSTQELEHMKFYAKKMKLKPWTDDMLWLIDCIEELASEHNIIGARLSVYERMLNGLTNFKLRDLQAGLIQIFTKEESEKMTPDERDERVMQFLRQAVLDFDPSAPKPTPPDATDPSEEKIENDSSTE